ncbi:hypothetical protein [Fretibacterium fastidiosum]|uniref:Lipoprotein n=1 Tax=Fretibacterium fastidiosum TaxID=651822 RepID=A0AB94IXU9_9BACT|nr:hypothetical protein [Fretibacterium fastidiosum]CBL28550.1 hypothetical protein SY1_15400 [Fretibacterium fastidiosum]
MKRTMRTACKTICLAMAALLLTAAAAMASPLVGGGDKGGDEAMERELEGGIHVTFLGAFRGANDDNKNYIFFRFIVEPQQDTTLKVDGNSFFDDNGNEFNWNYDAYIGNASTREREIIGGIKTPVVFLYHMDASYGNPFLARMTFYFNGNELVFRNVQVQDKSKKE